MSMQTLLKKLAERTHPKKPTPTHSRLSLHNPNPDSTAEPHEPHALPSLKPLAPPRALIIAAGEATRWKNYLGVPKHFAPVDGEPIIKRTIRLMRKCGLRDIHIVAPPNDPRYQLAGTTLFVPTKHPDHADADKFLNSRALWNTQGRTTIFYGDTYFTDAAMDAIVLHPTRGFKLFARPHRSDITGCHWGECFAISFWPEHIPALEVAFARIVDLHHQGRAKRIGGWELYRAFLGEDDAAICRCEFGDVGMLHAIDDWTDDFDSADDYEEFLRRRRNSPNPNTHQAA